MNLFKGVFWITVDAEEKQIYRIPCNLSGNVTGQTEYPLNAKDGTNYNHKLLWNELSKTLTGGKPFDFYPRGRVEIRNAKAIVYLNPDINREEIQKIIAEEFGLKPENGIKSVRFISDGSNHYRYQATKSN